MSVAALPAKSQPPAVTTWPRTDEWTCDDFELLGGMPSFHNRKLMLIDGVILEKAPPSSRASISQLLTENWLRTVFPPDRFTVRGQLGLLFGIKTDPVPDIAVVPGTPRNYARHPRTALLIVEIADSSLAYDTEEKASLYAAAGIADYWVIDVNNLQIHQYRNPQPNPTQHYGYGYVQHQVLLPQEQISPLASPTHSVMVAELLP
jgi:Uma2 family endonuclease